MQYVKMMEKKLRYSDIRKNKYKPKVNFYIGILIIILIIFLIRLVVILSNNTERGGFAYVQLLNIGAPVVQNQIYDEGNYAENRISFGSACVQALGLNKLTYESLIKNELSLVSICQSTYADVNTDGNNNSLFVFNPFEVSDESISKVESTPTTSNSKIYDPSLKKEIDRSKPEILIYHTHTQENYSPDDGDSVDENTNVVGVGDVLAKELEENYGIYVIHDKTDHCASYNDSYKRSASTVDFYLNKYGDFKMIIDLHRDSLNDKSATTTTVGDLSAAKVMFVNAKNSTRYAKNKEITEKIFNKTVQLFPGVPRKILTYNRGKNAFNQNKSDNSVLFEIGSNCNTPDEAKVTAQCMARVIAEILNR